MNKIKRTYVKHMTIESKGTYVQSLMDTVDFIKSTIFYLIDWTCHVWSLQYSVLPKYELKGS